MPLFEPIFEALNAAEVRYVVVGGVATVLHGFARLTADLDLIVDLEPAEARKAIATLSALGLRPRAPVKAASFADPAVRAEWIETKGMRVLSFWDPQVPLREVDVLAESPIAFEELWARSKIVVLSTTSVRVVSIPEDIWGDWHSVRIRKFTLGLEASPAQRLAWLEQAILFAHSVGALPARRAGFEP